MAEVADHKAMEPKIRSGLIFVKSELAAKEKENQKIIFENVESNGSSEKADTHDGVESEASSHSISSAKPKNESKAKKVRYILHGEGFKMTHIENFNLFYLQSKEQHDKYLELSEELNIYASQKENMIVAKNPRLNQLYLANINNMWRRVLLIHYASNNIVECQVKQFDLGSKRNLPVKNLYELGTAHTNLPTLVFRCALKGFDNKNIERETKKRLRDWIYDVLKHKSLTVDNNPLKFNGNKRNYSSENKINFIEIYDDKGKHINAMARAQLVEIAQDQFIARGEEKKRFPKNDEDAYSSGSYYNQQDNWFNTPALRPSLPHPLLPPPQASQHQLRFNSFPNKNGHGFFFQQPSQPSGPYIGDSREEYGHQYNQPYTNNGNLQMEMARLRGELTAYKTKLESLKNDSLSLNMLQDSIRVFLPTIEERKRLRKYLDEESPISGAIKYLFEDKTFHSKLDDILQLLDAMVNDKKNRRVEYGMKMDRLDCILRNFDVPELKDTLETHSYNLKQYLPQDTLVEYVRNAKKQVSGFFVTPYTKISQSFIKWKEEYLASQKKTDSALVDLTLFFTNLTSYLNILLDPDESSEAGKFSFTELNIQLLNFCCEKEISLAKQECIEKLILSLLEEHDLRLKKIRTMERMIRDHSLTSLLPNSNQENKSPTIFEDDYPSLVKFISQSRSMTPSIKSLVVQDVLADVCQLHSVGKIYKYINPQNIVMKEGAKLRKDSEICIYEPVLPWKFQAPECSNGSSISIGPTADCFSIGQLVIWLACLNEGEELFDRMKHIKSIPLISKLLDPQPSKRPTARQLQEQLPKIIPLLFEKQEAEVPKPIRKESESSDCSVKPTCKPRSNNSASVSGSFSSLQQGSPAPTAEEEEEQILRELMDSEPSESIKDFESDSDSKSESEHESGADDIEKQTEVTS